MGNAKNSFWLVGLLGVVALVVLIFVFFGRTQAPPAPEPKESPPVAAEPVRPEPAPESPVEPEEPAEEIPLSPVAGTQTGENKPEKAAEPVPASGNKVALATRDRTPPELQVLEPGERTYTLAPRLWVRAVSEAGAEVVVNGQKLAESEPTRFEGQLDIAVGVNKLEIEARDAAGNKKQAVVQVTYIDPEAVKISRERLQALISQIEEIRTAENEAEQHIEDILQKMKATAKSGKLEKLDAELREVRQSRRELLQEIEKEMSELDALLRSAGGG